MLRCEPGFRRKFFANLPKQCPFRTADAARKTRRRHRRPGAGHRGRDRPGPIPSTRDPAGRPYQHARRAPGDRADPREGRTEAPHRADLDRGQGPPHRHGRPLELRGIRGGIRRRLSALQNVPRGRLRDMPGVRPLPRLELPVVPEDGLPALEVLSLLPSQLRGRDPEPLIRLAGTYRAPPARGGLPLSYAHDLAPARCRFRSPDWTPPGGDTPSSLHRPLRGTPRIACGAPMSAVQLK